MFFHSVLSVFFDFFVIFVLFQSEIVCEVLTVEKIAFFSEGAQTHQILFKKHPQEGIVQ